MSDSYFNSFPGALGSAHLNELLAQQQNLGLAQHQMSMQGYANSFANSQANAISSYLTWPSPHVPISASVPGNARLIDRGEKIVNRIAFWQEVPVLGSAVIGRLADKLDGISERLEAHEMMAA